MAKNNNQSSLSSFPRLPTELRLQIWQDAIPSAPIGSSNANFNLWLSCYHLATGVKVPMIIAKPNLPEAAFVRTIQSVSESCREARAEVLRLLVTDSLPFTLYSDAVRNHEMYDYTHGGLEYTLFCGRPNLRPSGVLRFEAGEYIFTFFGKGPDDGDQRRRESLDQE